MKVKNILKDEQGNTLGATIIKDGKEVRLKTSYLQQHRDKLSFENAILDRNGHLKGYKCSLPVKIKTNVLEKYRVKRTDNAFYKKEEKIILYHGSNKIVDHPAYGEGEVSNDYGKGFYCVTERNIELAKEWACSPYSAGNKGFVNKYELSLDGLNILNLDCYNVSVWATITATYRKANVSKNTLQKLQHYLLPDLSKYDCVYGWRCDDSFVGIIDSFFRESLTEEALFHSIHAGALKTQFVLISEKAFKQIDFKGYESVKSFNEYRARFNNRIQKAISEVEENKRNYRGGRLLGDIIKELDKYD